MFLPLKFKVHVYFKDSCKNIIYSCFADSGSQLGKLMQSKQKTPFETRELNTFWSEYEERQNLDVLKLIEG